MLNSADPNGLIRDPSKLIEICRAVIDRLLTNDLRERQEKKEKFGNISVAINRLEKIGLPIPNELLIEKNRLKEELTYPSEGQKIIKYLSDEFKKLADELKEQLDQEDRIGRKRRSPGPRSYTPKTKMEILKKEIIKALQKLGGRGEIKQVMDEVGKQLEGKLTEGDLEWRESVKMYAWQHNVCWARYKMVQEGILRRDAPRGIWELTEKYL
jgi:hypothetical protein